jgi:hypothetical protein
LVLAAIQQLVLLVCIWETQLMLVIQVVNSRRVIMLGNSHLCLGGYWEVKSEIMGLLMGMHSRLQEGLSRRHLQRLSI